MAAPIVSGVVGLMLANNNKLKPQECFSILYDTGLNVGSDIGRLVQADRALRASSKK